VKVVHALGWYYPENLGGTEIYVAGLCRRMRKAGQDVYVAAPQAGREGTAEYLHEGVRVFRYSIPIAPSRDEAQGLTAARGAELFHRWLAGLEPDVLHVHSLVTGLGLFELRAAKRLGIPIVLTHHLPSLGYICRMGTLMERGVSPCDGIASPRRCAVCVLVSHGSTVGAAHAASRLPRSLSAALGAMPGALGTGLGITASLVRDAERQRELGELVDYQVVLNECGMRIVRANGMPVDRIVLNRLGTDHEAVVRKPSVQAAPTATPIRVGYLGRIDAPKGVRELLLAARKLPRDARFTLDIVGPMPSAQPRFSEDLYRIAAGDPRITFSPAVTSPEVPAVLARFDVLCCPSTGFENGPTVALEAMAVGTPIIASRIGNLAELVEDDVNGRLVAPGDVDALAAALREAVEHPAPTIDRWRTGLGAIRSLNEIANDYLALYARLDVRRARAS
jgi:glycosyltransferase involved in cell wall biosynthesis